MSAKSATNSVVLQDQMKRSATPSTSNAKCWTTKGLNASKETTTWVKLRLTQEKDKQKRKPKEKYPIIKRAKKHQVIRGSRNHSKREDVEDNNPLLRDRRVIRPSRDREDPHDHRKKYQLRWVIFGMSLYVFKLIYYFATLL